MTETDWLELWRKLVTASAHRTMNGHMSRFKRHVSKKSERPDPLLDYVLENVSGEMTVLDIGAGSGRWSIPLARKAGKVTAIEPSGAMADALRENIADAGLNNVDVIQSSWEEAAVEPHDIVVCVQAVYTSADLAGFIRRMEQHCTGTCYLAVRLPPADGVIAELFRAIYGHPYDSPNAIIAYNALYSLGIYANVLVEEGILNWENASMEEAFARAKRHLHLESNTAHDGLICDTLSRRLHMRAGSYVWPDGMRSALLWWKAQRSHIT
jgi:SAM-dependent methyltransferase